jgi:hypothetical protein
VSVSGFDNRVAIRDNEFREVPTAISINLSDGWPSPDTQIVAEDNLIIASPSEAIYSSWSPDVTLDLGGGPFGSSGGNVIRDTETAIRTFRHPGVIWALDSDIGAQPTIVQDEGDGEVIRGSSTHVATTIPAGQTDVPTPQGPVLEIRGQTLSHGSSQYTFPASLVLERAVVSSMGDTVYATYRSSTGASYVGRFSASLAYLGEYRFGELRVENVVPHPPWVFIQYRRADGAQFIGRFTEDLTYQSEFVFGDVSAIEVTTRGGETVGLRYISRGQSCTATLSAEALEVIDFVCRDGE